MVPGVYLKYAVFEFKMSSQVKFDPAILTGSKKPSWSQTLSLQLKKQKIGATMWLPEDLEDSPLIGLISSTKGSNFEVIWLNYVLE